MSDESNTLLEPVTPEQTTETCSPRSHWGVSKRKRSGSEEFEGDDPEVSNIPKKKYVQVNGSSDREDTIPVDKGDDELVAILDAGAQYGKIIDRRIRELSVRTVMLPLSTSAADIKSRGCRAIVISGGPNSVNDEDAPIYDPDIFNLELPILGICYGMQLINVHYGGTVGKKGVREDGQFTISVETDCELFDGLEVSQSVLLTHGDSVLRLADSLRSTARSGELIAAVQHKIECVFGVQFHPEADLTVKGCDMIRNFLYSVAGCHGNCTIENREEMCIEYIRNKVGDAQVLSLVSGGVDSAVCTALLNAALGPERVVAVHVDNGFMRRNESETVRHSLEGIGLKPFVIKASQRFFSGQTLLTYYNLDGTTHQQLSLPLHSVKNPEEKRRIIGDTFMKVADNVVRDLQLQADSVYLAQGTLRPDLIESASSLASSNAHVIKTHHNDTELVRELRLLGKVVEPLQEFHKDEVRKLGEALGLPRDLVHRHPFPGPGLAIRVLCQKEAYIRDDFASTNSLLANIAGFHQASLSPSPSLASITDHITPSEKQFLMKLTEGNSLYATILPIYSVGVQGDSRTYNYVAALSSSDTELNWDSIMNLAKLIPRICHNVNRVVWVFGGAVQGPIEEVTPTFLRKGVLATLRQADYLAHQVLDKHNALSCISQMPIVLIPIHFDRDPQDRPVVPSCQRAVVIRTFITSDFMTGIPATPGKHLPMIVMKEMVAMLGGVSGISRVLYDLTPKPPGTTEWE